jgi:1,3-beta-glucanosyltransferase GAS5
VCLLLSNNYSANENILDVPTCKRDLAKFVTLGINTIRTYAVDNTKDHDECMKLLAEAGIYVAVDVGTSWISLNREHEYALNASYNDDYLQRVFATTELFSKYDNTLLFFSGNEVIYTSEETWAAPYIKAVIRDIKRYLKERGLRQVPVGYSATDLTENRVELGEYLNCGSNPASRADFYAINDYSWCYPSSFEKSGWKDKVQMWKDYGIPLLFVFL